jgi:hypothetical protein
MNVLDIRFLIYYYSDIDDLKYHFTIDQLSQRIQKNPYFWQLYHQKYQIPMIDYTIKSFRISRYILYLFSLIEHDCINIFHTKTEYCIHGICALYDIRLIKRGDKRYNLFCTYDKNALDLFLDDQETFQFFYDLINDKNPRIKYYKY